MSLKRKESGPFFLLRYTRDLLGDIWTRPFTGVSERRPLEEILNEMFTLKLLTPEEWKTLTKNIHVQNEHDFVDVMTYVLVNSIQRLIIEAKDACR